MITLRSHSAHIPLRRSVSLDSNISTRTPKPSSERDILRLTTKQKNELSEREKKNLTAYADALEKLPLRSMETVVDIQRKAKSQNWPTFLAHIPDAIMAGYRDPDIREPLARVVLATIMSQNGKKVGRYTLTRAFGRWGWNNKGELLAGQSLVKRLQEFKDFSQNLNRKMPPKPQTDKEVKMPSIQELDSTFDALKQKEIMEFNKN